MTAEEIYEQGMQVMFNGVAVGLLWLFICSVLLGFVAWVRSVLG
jgi:hypothetical protein